MVEVSEFYGPAQTGPVYWDLRGLSTDTKPTDAFIPNGSSFLEMDTGDVYFWDSTAGTWRAL